MELWHENMLKRLVFCLEPNGDILGLFLFGSLSAAEPHYDYWSDIDVLVVVKNGTIDRYFPITDWINDIGRVYTYSQSSDVFYSTTRVCFEDFTRIDFAITTEENLTQIDSWLNNAPFTAKIIRVFSRSLVVDEIIKQGHHQPKAIPATDEQFLEMVRNFRFKSMLAVYKVIRNDLLVALHLSQDLVRDCCVLGMMLRDRKTGTNVHKNGGVGNELILKLEATQKPYAPIGILDSIGESNRIFERLACEWSNQYQGNLESFMDWLDKAKTEMYEKNESTPILSD